MNNKLIRLTEGDLHRIVKECVGRILNENRRDGNLEFVTGKDGYTNYVIDHDKKEVSPMHGYYPNAGKNRAKKLGYKFHGQDD